MEEKPLVVAELNPPLRATLVVDEAGLRQVGDFLSRCEGSFGFDVETNVAKTFHERKLRTIQIGNRTEQYVIDLLAFAGSSDALKEQGNRVSPIWAGPILKTISPYLETKKYTKLGFNLQFDYETTRWNLGIKTIGLYDCLLAEKVIYSGQVHFFAKDFWGADDIFARYTGLRINKTEQTGFDLETPLTPEQVEYAALDVRIPYPVRAGQAKMIDPAGLRRVVEIENSASPAFGEMHLNGFLLSREKWLAVVETTQAAHKDNVKQLDKFFVSIVGSKSVPNVDLIALEEVWKSTVDKEERVKARQAHAAARRAVKEWKDNYDSYEGEAAINYASQTQLLKALHKAGFSAKELPSTGDDILKKLSSKPIIKAIQKYRGTETRLKTFGLSFLEHIDPVTGRIHSDINQLGAGTGRTTSSKPNVQNIPKGSVYRQSFVSRTGWVVVSVDMAGAELRILAEESGEPAWVEAFAKGWDVHSVGAEIIFGEEWLKAAEVGGKEYLNDDFETVILPPCAYYNKDGKGRDHRKCECPGHKKLRDQIKAINFGIAYGMEAQKLADDLGITKQAAQKLLDIYRATFKMVTAYLKRSGENAKMKLASTTLAGRRRLFTRPTWEAAKEKAREWAKKKKNDPLLIGSNEVSRAYAAMYGSIEREGKNAPIQGFNADVAKLVMGDEYMFLELEQYFAEQVNFVHDEFVVECPAEYAQEVYLLIGRCIVAAAAEFMKSVAMDYDKKIAPYWGK